MIVRERERERERERDEGGTMDETEKKERRSLPPSWPSISFDMLQQVLMTSLEHGMLKFAPVRVLFRLMEPIHI